MAGEGLRVGARTEKLVTHPCHMLVGGRASSQMHLSLPLRGHLVTWALRSFSTLQALFSTN